MHKGIILLTKAEDKEEAKGNVEGFLEDYGDDRVWDWYKIGGRWSGILNKNTDTDDIMLAKDCKSILKEWEQDMNKLAEKHWKAVLQERKKEKEKTGFAMSGYYAGLYDDAKSDRFSSESNVYDTEEYTNKLPKNLKGYWAVMVDIHH